MSDVVSIFPDTLPSVIFHKYRELPTVPGIYFALLANGTVVYVGSSTNLQARWTNHHKFQECEEKGCVAIAYHLCKEEDLNWLEYKMIQEFNPSLNGPWHPRSLCLPQQVTLSTLKVTPEAWRMLRIITAYTGERQYAVLERVLTAELQKVHQQQTAALTTKEG